MQSAKPPPRDYSELFAGEYQGTPSPGSKTTSSPHKQDRIPNKSGAGKNFRANRLFEEEEEEIPVPLSVKTN